MAVASKPSVSARTRVPAKAKMVAELNSGVMPLSAKTPGMTNPPILLNSRSAPLWLLRLYYLQHRFGAITFLLVSSMLAVYGWAVYSQQLWNQEYRKLDTLQIHERQLTTTNEALKYQMVQQAQQPNTGLIPPNPAETIVLPPASQPAVGTAETKTLTSQPAIPEQKQSPIPLGY